jgi:hypothetical protein
MMHDRLFNPEEIEVGAAKRRGKEAWKMLLPLQAAEIQGSHIETKKAKKYKSICKGCIWVMGLADPTKVYLQPFRKTFDDYDERSFINAQGTRSLKRRPIFKTPWSLHFIIQVTDERIDETFVRTLFEVAGLRCGAGAYGPTFGRCELTEWKLVRAPKSKSK